MQVDTEIKVNYVTTFGDWFEEGTTQKEIDLAVEEHIKEFCEEHKIHRKDVEVTKQEVH